MNIFFGEYLRVVNRIEDQYPTPSGVEFRNRDFDSVKWSKPEQRNFFTIVKILAERGPSTINDIVENDGFSQQYKHKKSRYTSYRRIILGDKKTQVIGLIKKNVVKASKAENKLHKRYELNHYGIMYAVKLFMDLEIIVAGNYKNLLKMDPKIGWYDYSYQTKFPDTIIDILARNYSHVLPLIFGKWNYLKKNPRINVYRLYDLAAVTYNATIWMGEHISSNNKYGIAFNTLDGDIALGFYARQIESAPYLLELFLSSIKDEEILDFIDKLFYSYERHHRENFFTSQAHYLWYKGYKEKARKNMIKAIKSIELINEDDKKRMRNMTSEELFSHGMHFCE